MFTSVSFLYDWRGSWREAPRVVSLADCNARTFYLISGSTDVRLLRLADTKTRDGKTVEPWLDGGSRPVLLVTLWNPRIEFFTGRVEIEGVEEPGLCWAGSFRPVCTEGFFAPDPLLFTGKDQAALAHTLEFKDFRRQRIVLRSPEA